MLSFKLNDEFVAGYQVKKVPWGYTDAGGNSIGEITFLRTYSRLKEDGSKETWTDVCRRVVEGMYSIQKNHIQSHSLPWNGAQAAASAKECFDRLFNLKWTPPGRGLWMMGTSSVMDGRNSASLQNCAFISTNDMSYHDPSWPFRFLMDASMLGIGVGFDTKGSKKNFPIYTPSKDVRTFVIPDSREGWVEGLGLLIDSYLKASHSTIEFDYSLIRAKGLPIKGFGGLSSGPAPLQALFERIRGVLSASTVLSSVAIVDIMNMIGCCVVAGNIRRSAELALGQPDDRDFINLKNQDYFPERNSWDSASPGWGWASNNSLDSTVGMDYSPFIENIVLNGEPGFVWLDVCRKYGRLIDGPNTKDLRVMGVNPCGEQSLESAECCTLVETYINRHESLADFKRTMKFAYLYGKTVTLLPTHWPQTNAIMQRNRRIGTSISGLATFADVRGIPALKTWLDDSYHEVKRWDNIYSEWLCIRESVKVSTVKPSGTVSLLSGETPGVHWPVGGQFVLRSIRFSAEDPQVPLFRAAGYLVEPSVTDPEHTVVVYFPVKSVPVRPEKDVSLFEKANLAVLAQTYWSDNAVSVTLSFNKEKEADDVERVLCMFEGQMKSVSFLPQGNEIYQQQPYTEISEEEYNSWTAKLLPIDMTAIYAGAALEAAGEAFCSNDSCTI